MSYLAVKGEQSTDEEIQKIKVKINAVEYWISLDSVV